VADAGAGSRRAKCILWQLVAAERGGEAARRKGTRGGASFAGLGRAQAGREESPGEAHALATGGCGERRRGGAAKGHARRRILCQVGAGAGPGSRRAKRMLWQLVAAERGGEAARRKGTRGGASFAGLGLAQARAAKQP
jgi:hypothetical protein